MTDRLDALTMEELDAEDSRFIAAGDAIEAFYGSTLVHRGAGHGDRPGRGTGLDSGHSDREPPPSRHLGTRDRAFASALP